MFSVIHRTFTHAHTPTHTHTHRVTPQPPTASPLQWCFYHPSRTPGVVFNSFSTVAPIWQPDVLRQDRALLIWSWKLRKAAKKLKNDRCFVFSEGLEGLNVRWSSLWKIIGVRAGAESLRSTSLLGYVPPCNKFAFKVTFQGATESHVVQSPHIEVDKYP